MGVFAVQVETNNSTIPNETLHKTSDIPNETLSKTSDIPGIWRFCCRWQTTRNRYTARHCTIKRTGIYCCRRKRTHIPGQFFCSRRCTQQRKSPDYNSRGGWRQCSNQCRKISYCKDLKCYTSTLLRHFGLTG